MHLPELSDLELLDAVMRLGSLSAAARELGISQQAVSSRVRNLERRLGVVLLIRSHAGATPSAASAELLGPMRDVLDASARLRNAIAAVNGKGGGRLGIGASQTIAAHLIPAWLLRLREEQAAKGMAPTETVLQVGNSEWVVELVRKGAIDVGFIETPLVPRDLGACAVGWDCLVAVVPAAHLWAGRAAIPLEKLAATPLVVREVGSGTRVAFEEIVRRETGHPPVDPVVVFSTEAAVRSAVAGGLGPAVLSELTIGDDVRLGRVRAVAVSGADLTRPLTAVWRGGERDLLGAARQLIDVAIASRCAS